ncbi:MAG TPA: uracil-DNA glycosylase [Microbacteriaceae bacterium]|nr:uracil-DNA glycosylase [Microbacteriaceae bacterium]
MPSGPTLGAGWERALAPARYELDRALELVAAERESGIEVLPETQRVLRAFEQPFDDVRVVIVGQDPYPTPGNAVGLAFSIDADVAKFPASLRNILAEYATDLGRDVPRTGDLSPWAQRGVLLLNTTLTVRAGAPGSHSGLGWEEVTRQAVVALAARDVPLVGVLWGSHARSLQNAFGRWPTITSPHPSPLSAYRGFFGSRPFTRVNAHLRALGATPIDWSLA